MDILDRIEEIANNEGETITSLERIVGASKGVLSRAIAKKTDIQLKWVQKLVENYPQYSVDWLITGQGSMLRVSHSVEFQQPTVQTSATDIIQILLNRIEAQAQEISKLKEHLAFMEKKKNEE